MDQTYYLTTPIYYVNGAPHIGSATTTVACDVLRRYHLLHGRKAYMLTGTDENATKVVEAAEANSMKTMAFVDGLANEFKSAWKKLHIEYDDFIRTTEDRHAKVVQEFFQRLLDKGYVYKDLYEGWYSVSDETFLRDSEVENGFSKETGKPVRRVSEENYFFKLSAFGDRLLEHYRANPDFWQPAFRANEVVKFVEEGLRDMSITRRNTGWGIEVPGDPERVIYVWFDALINYLSATGWPDDVKYDQLWPANLHMVGKEIFVRFHATLWPAMLMALDLPLPKVVLGHGWWTVGGEKGSKSAGNLPHPVAFANELSDLSGCKPEFAVDALRYLLMREMRFGEDSEYTKDGFLRRFNSDLANDLGNVLNRNLAMATKFFEGRLPDFSVHPRVAEAAADAVNGYEQATAEFRFDRALEAVWGLVGALNKFIDESAPWAQHKAGDTAGAAQTLGSAAVGTLVAARLVSPYMPAVAAEIQRQLGVQSVDDAAVLASRLEGLIPAGHQLGAPEPIFPRVDLKKEVKKVSEETPAPPPAVAPDAPKPASDLITIDDFKKIQLKIARITHAEPHPNAQKLLKLTIDLGGESRPLVAGIAGSYEPTELVGKLIVVVANLQPAVIRGEESRGMLLATDLDGKAVLLSPEQPVSPGAPVK